MSDGLTLLEAQGERVVSVIGGTYEWDAVDVWRRNDGRLFLYADGGCSCNYEYEGVRGWDDLQPLSRVEQFTKALDAALFIDLPADQVIRHAKTVSEALRESA